MEKGNRGGKRTAVQTLNASSNGVIAYKTMTNAEVVQIRNDVDDKYTPSVREAIKQYIASDTKYTVINIQNSRR